jgi:hypothetical protein
MMSGWQGVPILFPLFEIERFKRVTRGWEGIEKTKVRG